MWNGVVMNTFFLAAPGTSFLKTSSELLESGIESQTFVKQLLRLGHYVNDGAGWKLDVTPELLHSFVSNFQTMKASGISVPFVSHHMAGDEPESFLGYWTDIYVDGDWLMGKIVVRGSSKIESVLSVDQVSVEIFENYVSSSGSKLGSVIGRVALTPNPVVSGQDGFQKIAASLKIGNDVMTKDFVDSMSALLGEEVTKDSVQAVLEETISDLRSRANKYEASATRVKELERKAVPDVDADLMADRFDLYSEMIDSLGLGAGLTEDAKKLALGTRENPKVLSLSTHNKGEVCLAREFIDFLKKLPSVSEGEKSLSQAKVLDNKSMADSSEKLEAIRASYLAMNEKI